MSLKNGQKFTKEKGNNRTKTQERRRKEEQLLQHWYISLSHNLNYSHRLEETVAKRQTKMNTAKVKTMCVKTEIGWMVDG